MKPHETGNGFSSDFNSFLKVILYLGMILCMTLVIFVVLGYFKVASYAFNTYDSYNKVPHHRVGLLLGTSSKVQPGQPNEFFTNRIMAASNLFHKQKVDFILVSGDNRHDNYDEPKQMTQALIRQGVPEDRIVADKAGYTTLDSVIRAKRVFLLDDVLIISQRFHNERAIFIADHHNLKASGFNAADPSSDFAMFKIGVREFFARIKGVFDVYIFNSLPEVLGDPVSIGGAPLPKVPSSQPKYATSKLKLPGMSLEGLRNQALEDLRPYAKQATDPALILKQRQRAMELMQQAGQQTVQQEQAAAAAAAEAQEAAQ